MRVEIQKIESGEDEVIVRYREKTLRIQRILDAIVEVRDKMPGSTGEDRGKAFGGCGNGMLGGLSDEIGGMVGGYGSESRGEIRGGIGSAGISDGSEGINDSRCRNWDRRSGRIIGKTENETVALYPEDIYYIETVDDKTFAYTRDEVVKLDGSLARLMEDLNDIRFFRCSKSVIINIDKVERLKALASNRIDATMKNGEHIMISRTYASEFRRILKGGRREG